VSGGWAITKVKQAFKKLDLEELWADSFLFLGPIMFLDGIVWKLAHYSYSYYEGVIIGIILMLFVMQIIAGRLKKKRYQYAFLEKLES
jgi:hypothetical protein